MVELLSLFGAGLDLLTWTNWRFTYSCVRRWHVLDNLMNHIISRRVLLRYHQFFWEVTDLGFDDLGLWSFFVRWIQECRFVLLIYWQDLLAKYLVDIGYLDWVSFQFFLWPDSHIFSHSFSFWTLWKVWDKIFFDFVLNILFQSLLYRILTRIQLDGARVVKHDMV